VAIKPRLGYQDTDLPFIHVSILTLAIEMPNR